ncbi:unnamed protein product [Pylaiella littoralis]
MFRRVLWACKFLSSVPLVWRSGPGTRASSPCGGIQPTCNSPLAFISISSSMLRGIHYSSSRRIISARASNATMAQPAAASNINNNGNGSSGASISSRTKPKTWYRRELKPPCVAFSSHDGRRLFREALVEGTMENYFRLAEQFRTQDEPAFCGLSTLTMVLNSLAVDPGRAWKGPWRWYHESMLDCCAPLDVVKDKGITMPALGCLARCNGLTVQMEGPDTHAIGDLRGVIEECCSEEIGKVVVVSYDRRGLKQTGTGHFSPIGGYHRSKDHVLIMDTARFKLPPHWVPLSVLWEAMKTVDPETGKARGYLVLEKAHSLSHRLFTINAGNYEDWPKVASWVNEILKLASSVPPEKQHGPEEGLRSGGGGDRREEGDGERARARGVAVGDGGRGLRDAKTVAEFVPPLLALLPPAVKDLLTTFNAINTTEHALGQARDGAVLQAIQGTEAYREVTRIERSGRSSGSDSGNSSGSADQARARAQAAAPPSRSRLSSPSPSSASSLSSPHESECGCSSRHVLSIMTYALLLLLHERGNGHGGGDGYGAGAACGVLAGGLPASVWRKNPLEPLPTAVADEARHVAGMLRGLVEMCECEKCTTPAGGGAGAGGEDRARLHL